MLSQVAQRLPADSRRVALIGGAMATATGVAGGLATAAVWPPLVGFALVFGLLLALAVMMNTQVGLVTVIAIAYVLPFAVIPLPIGGVKPSFLDAALFSLLAIWVLRLLVRREEKLVNTPVDGPLMVF